MDQINSIPQTAIGAALNSAATVFIPPTARSMHLRVAAPSGAGVVTFQGRYSIDADFDTFEVLDLGAGGLVGATPAGATIDVLANVAALYQFRLQVTTGGSAAGSFRGGFRDVAPSLVADGSSLLDNINDKTPALGQAAMAASVPVAIASDQPAVPVGTVLAATGGGTVGSNIDVDESGDLVVAGPATLWTIVASNVHSSAIRFLKLYNKATAPTVGTDAPLMTIPLVPAFTQTLSFGGGAAFGLGIGVGATTGVAANDTGAPGANEVVCVFTYTA